MNGTFRRSRIRPGLRLVEAVVPVNGPAADIAGDADGDAVATAMQSLMWPGSDAGEGFGDPAAVDTGAALGVGVVTWPGVADGVDAADGDRMAGWSGLSGGSRAGVGDLVPPSTHGSSDVVGDASGVGDWAVATTASDPSRTAASARTTVGR